MTFRFLLLWLATVSFFSAFYSLLVPLPRHLAALGLSPTQLGAVLGAFATAAIVARPLAALATDRVRPVAVAVAGGLLLALGSAALGRLHGVAALWLARALHGVAYAAFTTAGTVLAAQLAPETLRGRAMAHYGMAANVAMGFAPLAGQHVMGWSSPGFAFWLAAGLALLTLPLLAVTRPGRRQVAEAPAGTAGGVRPWARGLAVPALVSLVFGAGFGAFFNFLSLLSPARGFGDAGPLFTAYAAAIILARVTGGWLLDRRDRRYVLAPVLAGLGFSLLGMGLAPSRAWLLVAVTAFGWGCGLAHPGLIALAMDRVPAGARGRGVGAFYLAFDLGIGPGSWLLGAVLGRAGFGGLFGIAGGLAWLGAGALVAEGYWSSARTWRHSLTSAAKTSARAPR